MEPARLWALANVSVGRASAFGLLAIFCLMVGLAGYPIIALKTGGVALLFGAAILIVKAEMSDRRSYKRTELWTLLEKHERPVQQVAQQVIGNTLREAFYRFALFYAFGGFSCFAVALIFQFLHALLD